jgi:hypothetical protein
VAACLTAGDDDGVRATCDERAASGDGRDAATSGGVAGDDAGDDDDGDDDGGETRGGDGGDDGGVGKASGGSVATTGGGDDGGAEPPKKKKKGKTAAGRCGSGEWESLTRTRCESREASASGVRRTMSSVARGGDFGMGYSQSNATLDLCVDVLVRPAKRIKESNTTSIPLIPSHSKMESKQSKYRDNPGKYRTLKSEKLEDHPYGKNETLRTVTHVF